MKQTALVRLSFLWLAGILVSPSILSAGEVYGRITSQTTGFGIEGATVKLLTNGVAALTLETDVFGFYRLRQVPAQMYRFEASHPAYLPYAEDNLVVGAGVLQKSAALAVAVQGEIFFDVYLEAACAVTALQLRNVPVTLTVTPLQVGAPQIVRQAKTDEQGYCQFRGLPRGQFCFQVNQGAEKIPGWDSYQSFPQQLLGPHWASAYLKPESRTLTATVMGYDPVKQQANAPLSGVYVEALAVDPYDNERVLLPPQVGVSAIRKDGDSYWNNAIAGKVIFNHLPPVHYRVHGKRLGYRLATVPVSTDANAQLTPNQISLNMVLLNTKLTTVLQSPYNDPSMLSGVKVRLQGLKDSNTEGIDRVVTAAYEPGNNRTVAVFEQILPGNYRVTVNHQVEKTVSILVQGGQWQPPRRFKARFLAEDYVEAEPDHNRDVMVNLRPQPMILRGQLLAVDEDRGEFHYLHYAKTNEIVELRASEYFRTNMPPESHAINVRTDEKGMFTAVLMPGLYGVKVPGMSDYWGEAIDIMDVRTDEHTYAEWPYHQLWPYSLESALANFVGVGGFAVNSDQELQVQLFARRDWTYVDFRLTGVNDPAASQVLATFRMGNQRVTVSGPYHDILQGGAVRLVGGGADTNRPLALAKDFIGATFAAIPSGASYQLTLSHPRFSFPSPFNFSYYDHPAPGSLPGSEPPGFSYQGPHPMLPFLAQVGAAMPGSGQATFTVKRWVTPSEGAPYYETLTTTLKPKFIKLGYVGDRFFNYVNLTPNSACELWMDLTDSGYFEDQQEHWYRYDCPGGNFEGTIFIGGPSVSTANVASAPPEQRYDFVVEARNNHGRTNDTPINGVQVVFQGGWSATSGAAPLTALTNNLNFQASGVTHPNWIYSDRHVITVETGGARPLVRLTLYMQQGVSLRGQVVNQNTSAPIPDASINVTLAHGDTPILGPPTGTDGRFLYPFAFGRQPYFLEVEAPGYKPYRRRLDPIIDVVPNPSDPQTLALLLEGTNAVSLVPLDPPLIIPASISLDRFGAFLPGQHRAGNQSAFTGFSAEDTLTLTWRVSVTRRTNVVQLADFDARNGTVQPPVTKQMIDGLREVWLVDLRSFPTNSYSDQAGAVTPPGAANPHLVHKWLQDISAGTSGLTNVFHQRIAASAPTVDPATSEFTGQVKLWTLPPGQFMPAFVALTEMGAVTIHPFIYTGQYTGKELTGMRLPPWMATLAEVMGVVAGAQAVAGQAEELLGGSFPIGRFIPLPKFETSIEVTDDQFLKYQYNLEAGLLEGMSTPSSGWLGFAQGVMGLDLTAGLEASLDGQEREFYLMVKADAALGGRAEAPKGKGTAAAPEATTKITPRNVNKKGFLPALKKVGKILDAEIELDPKPSGQISHISSQRVNAANQPTEFKVTHAVQGQVGTVVNMRLGKVVKFVPKVGQILYALDKSEALVFGANMDGIIGLRSETAWQTVFPRQLEHYIIVDPAVTNQWRRHFLGGNEKGAGLGQRSLDLAVGFGMGMSVKAVGGRVGATAGVGLEGTNSWTGRPAMRIDINPNGDWHPLKRIRGNARASLELFINAWILQHQKRFEWTGMHFDHQFGTETAFYLLPMSIAVSETRRQDYVPVAFEGNRPQLIRDFLKIGTYATASVNGQGLVFTDVVGPGGDMALRFSRRDFDGNWQAPVLVATTPGAIIASEIQPLPGGNGWMAVWTEISADNVNDTLPPSTIRYATSDAAGANWSAPAVAVSLSDVANHLRLVPLGAQMGLVFMETGEGPRAENYRIQAASFNGANWSAPTLLLDSAPVIGFDAAGTGNAGTLPAQIAFTDAASQLWSINWNGGAGTTPLLLATNVDNDLQIVLGTDQTHYLGWGMRGGGLGLARYPNGASAWLGSALIWTNARPAELRLAYLHDSTTPVLALAWAEGGNPAEIRYGFAGLSGTPLSEPLALTANSHGRYFGLDLTPGANREASVFALFDNSASLELRTFTVAFPGTVARGDLDGDGLADLSELWIVDANPQDAITTIDQVTGAGDFDQDGYSNQTEINLRSSPVNAADFPAVTMFLNPPPAVTAGAQWRVNGSPWLESGDHWPVPPGQARVEFGAVPGWFAPPNLTNNLAAGQALVLTNSYLRARILAVYEAGAGSGSVTSNPAGIRLPVYRAQFAEGTSVTLTATPDVGSVFDAWSGAASGSNLSVSVLMDADRTVTATFSPVSNAPFTQWLGGLFPGLPPERRGAHDRNGPLDVPNLVAYALGFNPLMAGPEDLGTLRRDPNSVAMVYRRSRQATDVQFRAYQALSGITGPWSLVTTANHRKTADETNHEVWEVVLPITAAPSHGFMRLDLEVSE